MGIRENLRVKIFLTLMILTSLLSACARTGMSAAEPAATAPGKIRAVYVSEKGEELVAVFDTGEQNVQVRLPDGSRVSLPLAVSGSGARYSNGKETFWEHQGTGSYWKGAALIFEGRLQSD